MKIKHPVFQINLYVVITFFLISLFGCSLDNKSQLTETEKLFITAKVWGFLKYYHPEVGSGKFDWDQKLFSLLSEINKVNNKKELSLFYVEWIEHLGDVKSIEIPEKNFNYFDRNFDLSWLRDNRFFTKELSKKLDYIKNNRFQGKHYYVKHDDTQKTNIINEPVYKNLGFPDLNHRLLTLFRYWNIIEYFYPYKYLTDKKWDVVLFDMIPKFKNAKNITEYQNAIKELVGELDDAHAKVIFQKAKNEKPRLPFKIKIIENETVISEFYNDSIATINNLQLGDIILEIDGKNIDSVYGIYHNYISAPNEHFKRKMFFYLFINNHTNDSIVGLTIRSDSIRNVLNVKKYSRKLLDSFDSFKRHNIDTSKIGYINMKTLKKENVYRQMNNVMNKKALIIDLRNYPNFIYRELSKYLNSEKRKFSKVYYSDLSFPGRFIVRDLWAGSSNKNSYKGKVILLVDSESISRSEFTAMALQTADNIVTIGNNTFGTDGDVGMFELVGGYLTSFSSKGVLYADGTQTQRKGIKIDIYIEPTIEGISQGKDEVLEKAISIANQINEIE